MSLILKLSAAGLGCCCADTVGVIPQKVSARMMMETRAIFFIIIKESSLKRFWQN